MSSHRTLRHAVTAASLLVAFLLQGTWALAGVTGNIAGTVKDSSGAPIADVSVQAVAASGVSTTTTDAGGHFILLSLNPDTYTVNLSKSGYQDISFPGVTVFADQTQQIALTMTKQLKVIAHTTSTAGATGLVKSGISSDLYQVNAAQIQASTAVGGGGNLNSIYSAIATTPGLIVGTGGMGWNQPVVIHGSNPFFSGFEYDGIPVNRAFDNYTSSTGSSLGLQQLEVYTGGGPSAIASNGVSGFINQVIKTGTFPGYANINGGIGSNAFYHQFGVEAGGSTPDRNFSYYVGLSGYNQAFRYIDQNNGGGITNYGSAFSNYDALGQIPGVFGFGGNPWGNGTYGACTAANLQSTPSEYNPFFDQWLAKQYGIPTSYVTFDSYLKAPGGDLAPGCLIPYSGLMGFENFLTDRENVVNLHMGIPHHNGLRDDVQLLWSASALKSYFQSAPNDAGPGATNFGFAKVGWYGYSPQGLGIVGPYQAQYTDAITYNQPFGSRIASCETVSASGVCTAGLNVAPTQVYSQPNSPQHSFDGTIPGNLTDLTNNDTGIVKLQYTHALDPRSFLRVYAYTFFSDWTEDGPVSGSSPLAFEYPFSGVAPDYDLITHTSGGQLQYTNQINDQNLIQVTGNYTQASVVRFNNTGYAGGASPIGYISQSNGVYSCWDPSTGQPSSNGCISGYRSNAAGGPTGFAPPGSPAAKAGAYWASLWNYNASGTYNQVKPQFYNAAISDQLRPNDKWLFDMALRYDSFTYNLPSGFSQAQNPFYAQIVNDYVCYNYNTGQVLTNPLGAGAVPPPTPVLTTGSCSDIAPGYIHPGQTNKPFTLSYPSQYTQTYWEPRISGTYTQSPDTVWRFSAGRYAEPPISASVNYLYRGGSGVNLWASFMNAGFLSPFHPIPGMSSGQYSLSYEHHMSGTQWSLKVTPFYNATSNWEQQSFIGANFVTQIPVGQAQSYGSELALNYGDFSRNGWSGTLALTYTQSQVKFQNLLGQSQVNLVNQAIANYNQLTKAGGGSQCYSGAGLTTGFGTPESCKKAGAIYNMYYNKSPQGFLDPNAWYPQGSLALALSGGNNNPSFYNTPWVATILANWRHDKLAITPSLQFESGAPYGSPLDTIANDPRTCTNNQGMDGVADNPHFGQPGSSLWCDYRTIVSGSAATASKYPAAGYLYIPNPQTGSYASIGQYTQPNILIGNLQATYDVSPRVRLQLTGAGIFHACWGGTAEPWTAAAPPGGAICGYLPNGWYTANAFNGTSPYDKHANPTPMAWETQSYIPKSNNTSGGYLPFNLYITGQIRL